jgi:hypothetical protein
VPTCCRELADRSGAAARERADRSASYRMRPLDVMAIAFPPRSDVARHVRGTLSVARRVRVTLSDARHTFGNPPIASGIISLTALSCRRTFADSAIKKASVRRQRFVPD